MTALPALSVTDRYKLKQFILERSVVLPPGRVWWCRGRKIIAQGTIENIPGVVGCGGGECDTLCVSPTDYPAVKGWIG